MKVLFAHDGVLFKGVNDYYGIQFNDSIRQRYLNLGSTVTFMVRIRPLNQQDETKFARIKNINFKVVAIPDFKSIRLYVKNKKRAEAIIEQTVKNHDIIIARLPSANGSMAIKYARKFEKPFLVEYVACTFDAYWNFNWKGKAIAFYKMLQQKRLMQNIPFCIYVTKTFLQRRYPTHGKSINCSNVEIPEMDENRLQKRIRDLNKIDFNKPFITATIAALDVKYKGQADVIQSVAYLKRKGIYIYYHLVGHGDPSYLKKIIKKYDVEDLVKIIGPLKHDRIFHFLKGIALYIQPSKTEGLPRAVIEAMSTGCPVLGSNVGGIPELLDSDMVFKPGVIHVIAI